MAKAKAGPAAIVIGVVVLAAVIFVIYHFTLGQSGPKPNPATIPGYVRAGMSDAQLKDLGITRSGAPANGSAVAAGSHANAMAHPH